jgi:hypothetical protein
MDTSVFVLMTFKYFLSVLAYFIPHSFNGVVLRTKVFRFVEINLSLFLSYGSCLDVIFKNSLPNSRSYFLLKLII